MVFVKPRDAAQLDEEAEKARLARKAEMDAEREAFNARRRAEQEASGAAEAAKKKEEERILEEKRKEEERVAEEAKREEEAREKARVAEEQRIAEEKKKEEERIAEEKKKEEERAAAEQRRVAEEKKREEERAAEEAKQKEAQRLAEEKRIAEKKRREEEAEADRLRREEEERRKTAEAIEDMNTLLELDDGPILFDNFGEMGLRCISHRDSSKINANPDGSIKVVIGCCNLEKARLMLKLEKPGGGGVIGEHAVMCTMSHSSALGPHFVAEALCPAPGEYPLKFFCNNEGGKSGYAHVCTYNIVAAAGADTSRRFPKLHPAVAMALIEPMCDELQAGQTVTFKVVLGPGVTAAQVANPDGKRFPLSESRDGEQRIGTGSVTIVSGDQNEGMVTIICQKDGGEEWIIYTKFAVRQ